MIIAQSRFCSTNLLADFASSNAIPVAGCAGSHSFFIALELLAHHLGPYPISANDR